MIPRALAVPALAVLLAVCSCSSPSRQDQKEPVVEEPGRDAGSEPVKDLVFQPAFHQALRLSESYAGLTTVRMRIPLGRAGERLRVTFKAGDGSLELRGASVARAGESGLASAPVALTFAGQPGFSASARERRTSDPLPFPVGFRDEICVSFALTGAAAASSIELFPGGRSGSGDQTGNQADFGLPELRAIGVADIDVEAEPTRAFVTMGDSITEGYVEGKDDYREAWPAVTEELLRLPVGNAGVSGQGVDGELERLDEEVLSMSGVTDCIVLLGTNDLGGTPVERIERNLGILFSRLKPFCRVWAGTLPPKGVEAIYADRNALNAWIRTTAEVDGVIDFAAVLADPANPDLWKDGMHSDHVHVSVDGHRAMGQEAARVLGAQGAD